MTVTKKIDGKAVYKEIDEENLRYYGYKGWVPVQKTDAHVAVKKEKKEDKE